MALFARTANGQKYSSALVPGTGVPQPNVGDDFEDPNWGYTYHNPKNSEELDGNARKPNGYSNNRRWFEGPLRGHPDVLKRVTTPEGGLEGSHGALLMRSLYTGVPNRPSGKNQQDDLVVNVRNRIGGLIPVSWSPSFVVRVYLPPFEQWENRTGNTFAVRAGTHGVRDKSRGLFDSDEGLEEYWPGMWVYFYSETDRKHEKDSAMLRVRAGHNGRDYDALPITETGWWTMGMSFTPDGKVHYYASPGVDPLAPADHIATENPYGFRCHKFETFFFDVLNRDNGRDWSTPWIIDDPTLYTAFAPEASRVAKGRTRGSKGR